MDVTPLSAKRLRRLNGGLQNLYPRFESGRRLLLSEPDQARPDPKESRVKPISSGTGSIPLSRQCPNKSGTIRPPIASVENAYALNSDADDPDLATVVAVCPGLPEVIKAGILAMVKTASGNSWEALLLGTYPNHHRSRYRGVSSDCRTPSPSINEANAGQDAESCQGQGRWLRDRRNREVVADAP